MKTIDIEIFTKNRWIPRTVTGEIGPRNTLITDGGEIFSARFWKYAGANEEYRFRPIIRLHKLFAGPFDTKEDAEEMAERHGRKAKRIGKVWYIP